MAQSTLCLVFLTILGAPGLAQTPVPVAPVPSDPLEPATGPVELVEGQQRQQAWELLNRARQNHDLHRRGGSPFILKVNFSSYGNSAYTGNGEIEALWINGQTWRWTTRIGDYAQLRITTQGKAYDEKPGVTMPLRVRMVRSAVFWPILGYQKAAYLRTAEVSWNGKPVTCLLISAPRWRQPPPPTRQWEESEYCIEPKSGQLQTYSIAPRIYSTYDYSDALPFHGQTLPRQIAVMEGGRQVLQIQLDSIQDPSAQDQSLLTPTPEMVASGSGLTNSGSFRFPQIAAAPAGTREIEPVIVNAVLGEDGSVLDAEALQTTDPTLSDAALALVRRSRYRPPGNSPGQSEAFINVKFVPLQ